MKPETTKRLYFIGIGGIGMSALARYFHDIGTFSETVSGQTNVDYVLCFGDELEINTNNDWTAPNEQFNPPGPAYDPGIGWLVYSCPPTIGLVPSANEDVIDDPCLLGVWGYGDFAEINDQDRK